MKERSGEIFHKEWLMRNTGGNSVVRLEFAKNKWKNMNDVERAPFVELASIERKRLLANRCKLGVQRISVFLQQKGVKPGKGVLKTEKTPGIFIYNQISIQTNL